MRRFENKRAVVTGASSGVGRAIAAALAAEGAVVALVGRDEFKLENVRKALATNGHNPYSVFSAEFCDDASVALLGSTLARSFPSVDVLVHSAGVIKMAPFASASLEDLDTHYRCNVRAPVALTQHLLPALIAAKGSVVFINSSVVDNARAGISQYAASKQALKAIADSLRDEVNREGVRVLSVFLGRTATAMQQQLARVENRPYEPDRLIQPEDVASLVVNSIATPRTVELTNVHVRPGVPPS